jgi:hypothetical protein
MAQGMDWFIRMAILAVLVAFLATPVILSITGGDSDGTVASFTPVTAPAVIAIDMAVQETKEEILDPGLRNLLQRLVNLYHLRSEDARAQRDEVKAEEGVLRIRLEEAKTQETQLRAQIEAARAKQDYKQCEKLDRDAQEVVGTATEKLRAAVSRSAKAADVCDENVRTHTEMLAQHTSELRLVQPETGRLAEQLQAAEAKESWGACADIKQKTDALALQAEVARVKVLQEEGFTAASLMEAGFPAGLITPVKWADHSPSMIVGEEVVLANRLVKWAEGQSSRVVKGAVIPSGYEEPRTLLGAAGKEEQLAPETLETVRAHTVFVEWARYSYACVDCVCFSAADTLMLLSLYTRLLHTTPPRRPPYFG